MFGTVFDKATGLLTKRFVLGLLLPCLAFAAGVAVLVVTAYGWTSALAAWRRLSAGEQWLVAAGVVVVATFLASVVGTQIGSLTRFWEGYWRFTWLRWPGTWIQRKRRDRLHDENNADYRRKYHEFPADDDKLLPTRLGNALRAAESYSGADERYGVDAVFFWPRLYLVLPDVARDLIEDARSSLDQMLVVTTLSVLLSLVALGMGIAGSVSPRVWVSVALGSLVLALLTYRSAVRAAVTFGNIVRSCFDLYRRDLLAKWGFALPATLDEERALWKAVAQQMYRLGADESDLVRFTI